MVKNILISLLIIRTFTQTAQTKQYIVEEMFKQSPNFFIIIITTTFKFSLNETYIIFSRNNF